MSSDQFHECGARIRSGCRTCGVILDDQDRMICDGCLPAYERERAEKLTAAGTATLAAMRASADDPARSELANAKRVATSRSTSLAMRVWEREHGKGEPETYEREILPRIRLLTVPRLVELTGVSQYHCWKVRNGDRRLHARHWEAVRSAEGSPEAKNV